MSVVLYFKFPLLFSCTEVEIAIIVVELSVMLLMQIYDFTSVFLIVSFICLVLKGNFHFHDAY